jgi:hypothetical protein
MWGNSCPTLSDVVAAAAAAAQRSLAKKNKNGKGVAAQHAFLHSLSKVRQSVYQPTNQSGRKAVIWLAIGPQLLTINYSIAQKCISPMNYGGTNGPPRRPRCLGECSPPCCSTSSYRLVADYKHSYLYDYKRLLNRKRAGNHC